MPQAIQWWRPGAGERKVDQARVTTFNEAATDFAKFAADQGFPAHFLWITAEDIVFWKGHYFVLRGDPAQREVEARERFNEGLARTVGIELEGKSKADGWTICRVYVPEDDIDAQYRMIPQQGVKMSIPTDPKPTVLLKNRPLFQLIYWWRKKTYPWQAWN